MAKPAAKSKWIFASLNCLLIFAMRVDTARAVDDPWARAHDQELSETETKRVLDRIESDLRIGTPWATVYERFADEFRANGRPTTAIGNLGHFVVFQDPQLGRGHFVDIDKQVFVWEGEKLPRRLWRMKFLDASHVVTLTHATSGDIVRLHSAVYHQTVLYQVQELYRGRATY